MRASVFVGTSLDGFIARAKGVFDFLLPGGGEEHGYDAFFDSVDALVIGRKTFENVAAVLKLARFTESQRKRPDAGPPR